MSVRDAPGSSSVAYEPTSPHVTVNGPTVAGATRSSFGWQRVMPPAVVGLPEALPTHTW